MFRGDLLLMSYVRIGVVPASVRAAKKQGLVESMLGDKENNEWIIKLLDIQASRGLARAPGRFSVLFCIPFVYHMHELFVFSLVLLHWHS